jgi:hypothetical protein
MKKLNNTVTLSDGSGCPATEAQFFKFYEDIPEVDREKPAWNCTGEYLKKHRPRIYEQALMMLCEPGISIRSICRTLHVSHNTLASIQEREAPNLDTRKKHILRTVTRGLRICAERAEELAPTMTARDALVGVGILGEKMELLSGSATQRLESVQPVNVIERFQAFCHEMEKRVEARQRAAQIDSGGENKIPNDESKQDGDSRAPAAAQNDVSAASIRTTLALPAPNLEPCVGNQIPLPSL